MTPLLILGCFSIYVNKNFNNNYKENACKNNKKYKFIGDDHIGYCYSNSENGNTY